MKEIMNLTNAVALITGGSAGIGRPIAQALAASAARVAITGRDKARLEEAAQTLGVFAIHADVTNESDVLRTYREVLAKFGDLDILVNNAGIRVFKNLVDLFCQDSVSRRQRSACAETPGRIIAALGRRRQRVADDRQTRSPYRPLADLRSLRQ